MKAKTVSSTSGPVGLTALGVGAIIGTGIFVLTGVAAAEKAGPAMIALDGRRGNDVHLRGASCYAEFAAMVPVAGSAYTYAYATLGELFAWIIGWDLVLEYAGRRVDRRSWLVTLLPGLLRSSTAASHSGRRSWPTPPLISVTHTERARFLDRFVHRSAGDL